MHLFNVNDSNNKIVILDFVIARIDDAGTFR